MPYKYNKLKGKIKEKYETQSNFAKAVKKSENSLSKKLKGKSGFSQEDIQLWSKLLEIPKDEIGLYFFT